VAKSQALPKYIQVSEMLIRDIAAGLLPHGARLPPERDMARGLDISVGTLRKALSDLEEKGMLDRVQGSGNYVKVNTDMRSLYAFFRLEKLDGGGLPRAEVLGVERLPKPDRAPPFGPATEGHRIRRLRWLDETLIALEEIWLDGDCRDVVTIGDLSDSLYHFYRAELGIDIAAVEDRISVSAVPKWSPQGFHLRPGQMTGYIERVSSSANKAAVEFSRTWFDTERARYVSRMGRG
jgi:GntR family transcriptional regulator